MNRFNRILYIICLACISSLGCKKNSTGGNTPPPVVDETITASIQGRIVDENGTPGYNATVSVGASTSNSDIMELSHLPAFKFQIFWQDKNQ